jgi:phosphatidylinositol 3-kinase
MCTNEGVIASALNEHRDFDIFRVVRASKQFISSTSLNNEYVRFFLSSLDGYRPQDQDGRIRCATVLENPASPLFPNVYTVYVECTLLHLGQPLGPAVLSSHSYTSSHQFHECITFPAKYNELPLDSYIACTVHSAHGVVGTVCFYPFTSRGELKTGSRRYALHMGKQGPHRAVDDVLGGRAVSSPSVDQLAATELDEVWELAAREKAHGRIADVPWLDTLTTAKISQLSEARRKAAGGRSAPSTSAPSQVFLSLELPTTSNALPVFFTSIPSYHDSDAWAYDVAPSCVNPVYDLERGMENVCEVKASTLARSMYLMADVDVQPGFREKKQIAQIIRRPLIQVEPIKVDDAALLWRFRQSLVKDAKAFLPFMSCVDWSNRGERTEAERLMALWKPIETADALVCLAYMFRGTYSIRRYAVDRLSREQIHVLHPLALQLVQGARYDTQGELFTFLCNKGASSWEFCCHVFWFMCVEVDVERATPGSPGNHSSAPSNVFTTMRKQYLDVLAVNNPAFLEKLRSQERLKTALNAMHAQVHKEGKDRSKKMDVARECIKKRSCGLQDVFVESVVINDDGGSGGVASVITSGVEALTAAISSPFVGGTHSAALSAPITATRPRTVSLPSHPSLELHDITDDGFYMFKSAKMPMIMKFRTTPREDDIIPSAAMIADGHLQHACDTVVKPPPTPPLFPIIFKCGDDVRQDQLVIQIIEVMDGLLKDNGLDLCLTPYRVIATSPNDGFMEVVQQVETFQNVQKDVIKYLATHNKTTETFAAAMDRFVKSCAGYCVVTFLLGIGDRHLENLLITADGRLLHIDFGFIFGNDPKPFPPPMKINKEMVDTMGGPQSAQYSQFKAYCCSAYNILRQHYSVIMALLLLMVDASIPQISPHGSAGVPKGGGGGAMQDPRSELVKVQDKFRLDLNNAEATQYIQNVIADSVGAIFTTLWDVIHLAAQAARN